MFFVLSKVHFFPKQKLISYKPCTRKREQRHAVDPHAAFGLGTSFTVPPVLAVHVLLEPSFELSQLVLGSVDHL